MDRAEKEFIEKTRELYKTYEKIYCAPLHTWIQCNAKGFHHLRFKTNGKAREKKEQIYKLRLIPFIREIIENAQAIEKRMSREKKKEVIFWGITGNKNNEKIKVIAKKVGRGKTYFWSIMKRA